MSACCRQRLKSLLLARIICHDFERLSGWNESIIILYNKNNYISGLYYFKTS